ncbi:NlpC/P60 family protein [Enterobacter sichuanensis]|uniref:C40 family peptidase n=1 Tax=Enterobacter sichuanensis TaxID=2071710 RepID=UPI002DB9784C|nr:NlpC/P60 family protein [Enterobacter sichuanensis]MEB5959755.1 NlpC/P60 family protein [Enterobacter sichuanensis]
MLRLLIIFICSVLSFSSFAFDKIFIQEFSVQAAHPDKGPFSDRILLQQKIMSEFLLWKGTRYQWGGDSHTGIDCSAFTRRIIDKTIHLRLPRTALEQSRTGRKVRVNQLNAGDLVFFMTRPNVRHVGVYVGKGKFIHASSSQGVMVSELSDAYWQEHYLTARRVNA